VRQGRSAGALCIDHSAAGSLLAIRSSFSDRVISRGTTGQARCRNLAVSVLRDTDRAFWTRTVWRDEEVMRSFMQSGVHRQIMARLPEWCDEAALVHWVQDAVEPPSWPEAHQRLQEQGRRSRVSRPSEAHRRFEIREPRAGMGLRLK
jgi:Domain of unknown function (DUF3291)